MDSREQNMPSNNRPDERKREEARIARANQLKPLAEPETPQVVQGDNTFSRVDVPNNERDHISKTVREVLGPYYTVLGGSTNGYRGVALSKEAPATNAEKPKISDIDGGIDHGSSNSVVSRVSAKQPTLDTGQHQSSGHAHSNSSGPQHKPLNSSIGTASGDSKRISTSSTSSQKQASHMSSSTPSKQPKAPVVSTPSAGSHLSVNSVAVHSSSSPVAPVLSRYDTKDIPVATKLKDGSKEINVRHRDKEHTPPPPSLTAKQALAHLGKSPVKDASPSSVQSNHLNQLPSQSHSSSKVKSTPKDHQLSPSTSNDITTQQSSASKDHKISGNHQPSPTLNQVSNSASTTVTLNQKHSMSPSLPSAQSHASSPSAPAKVSSSPKSSLQSATPTKISALLPNPNGVTTHSKLATLSLSSSSSTLQKTVNTTANASTGSSVEKSRSLKLCMPNESKTATTKSDLNDIFKEMTVQPPLTSIETPQKAGHKFPFPLPAIRDRVQTLDISKEKVSEDAKTTQVDDDKLTDAKGCQQVVKDEVIIPCQKADIKEEELSQKEDKAQTCSVPPSRAVKDEENMKQAVSETAEEKLKEETESPVKRSPVDEKVDVGEIVTADLPCYSSRKPSIKSLGKTISDENSILIRDLDLSEDSDAEPTSEDNTSASQSKKGKVIATTGAAPVKRAQSPMSSSSSSDSSSESGGEDDDDDDDDDDEEENQVDGITKAKISSERRSSSSSSNSSSESSSDSSSEENEDDNEDKDSGNEGELPAVDRGEKTPSPPNHKGIMGPASVGTPSAVVQSNNEDRIWQLGHFIHSSKKSSTSPANASPSKPVSPPTCHSAPPSVQHKEDAGGKSPEQPTQRSLKEIGPCNSMPFDIQRLSDDDSDDQQADREDNDDEEEEVFRRKHGGKTDPKLNGRKSLGSSSGPRDPKQPSDEFGKRPVLKDSKADLADRKKFGDVLVKDSKMLNSISNSKDKKAHLSVSAGKLTSFHTKKRRSKTGSSSDDEIDVVGFTPDKKTCQPASSPDKTVAQSKQEVTKQLNGVLSMSSDEDSKSTMPRGKNVPSHLIKTHRRKGKSENDSSTPTVTHPSSHESSSSRATTSPVGKASKKLPTESEVALDHLESISRPPNLLSPIHPVCSPPPSTKPLPSFQTSFSPAPVPMTHIPPIITLSHGTARPKIMIQINKKLLSEKSLSRLKEKKEKRRRGGQTSSDTKSLEPTSKCDIVSEPVRESRVPPITDVKSSPLVNSSIRETDASSLQASSGAKRRAPVAADAGEDATPNLIYKIPKSQKTSSELSSSTSVVSQETDSASVPQSNKFTSSVSAHKSSGSNAVKNIDFSISCDSSRGDKGKPHKRKPDHDEEPTSKKTKGELPTPDRSSTPTVGAPAPIRKRRDSANSTSSKSSRQSISSKKSRRSSNASNISNNNNNNNNNNIDKPSQPVTNGPTLPFNSYGTNGTTSNNSSSRVTPSSRPASLPSPLPVESQLLGHEHYLSRAKEHKHHADSQKDKMARFEPYLRSGLSFFLAGFSMEQCKKDINASYSLYNDTSNLLQYAIRLRVSSSSSECTDRERKLIVLIIRLRAYLNHRLYRLRKSEVSKLKKVIESEQSKLHTSSASATSTAGTATSSASANTNSKPHAPSPHQNNWNKNSTGTPSPMSPTPSPATSVSSQGSCELVTGKIPNGTSLTSPSPGMVSVHQRVHTVTQKYFALTSHLVKAMELWDQADAETKGLEDFFNILDTSCGVLTFHSDPPVIVRYMKHALRLLNL